MGSINICIFYFWLWFKNNFFFVFFDKPNLKAFNWTEYHWFLTVFNKLARIFLIYSLLTLAIVRRVWCFDKLLPNPTFYYNVKLTKIHWNNKIFFGITSIFRVKTGRFPTGPPRLVEFQREFVRAPVWYTVFIKHPYNIHVYCVSVVLTTQKKLVTYGRKQLNLQWIRLVIRVSTLRIVQYLYPIRILKRKTHTTWPWTWNFAIRVVNGKFNRIFKIDRCDRRWIRCRSIHNVYVWRKNRNFAHDYLWCAKRGFETSTFENMNTIQKILRYFSNALVRTKMDDLINRITHNRNAEKIVVFYEENNNFQRFRSIHYKNGSVLNICNLPFAR